jgi:hypothetical protein
VVVGEVVVVVVVEVAVDAGGSEDAEPVVVALPELQA